jgi:hypothetical protein
MKNGKNALKTPIWVIRPGRNSKDMQCNCEGKNDIQTKNGSKILKQLLKIEPYILHIDTR